MKKVLVLVLLTASLCATTVTFKGEEVTLNSKGLKLGMEAPVFTAVDKDFMEVSVGGKSDKVQVIAFIPSFDSMPISAVVLFWTLKSRPVLFEASISILYILPCVKIPL